MSPLRSALFLLFLLVVQACDNQCRSQSSGGGTTGEITYTTGDGTTLRTKQVDLWGAGTSSVDLRSQLGARSAKVLITNLVPGTTRTLAHDDTAKACLPVQSDAAPTCLLLDGTVEVKKLARHDCEGNENITLCEEEVDLTIHATSHDQGLSLTIDLDVTSTVRWTPSRCGPD